MNNENVSVDKFEQSFSRKGIEDKAKHLWFEGDRRRRGLFIESLFSGTAVEGGFGIDSDQVPCFHDATPPPGAWKELGLDTPSLRIAMAIIFEAITTASLPPLKVTGHRQAKYFHDIREKERQEAIDWIFADNEEDDLVLLHTFNNCCMYLNVSPQKIRSFFEKNGRNMKVSIHQSYAEE